MNRLRSIKDNLARKWSTGGWKVKGMMGGSVVVFVFVVGLGFMAILGGGGEAQAEDVEGVSVGADGVMVFDDEPAVDDVPAGGDGGAVSPGDDGVAAREPGGVGGTGGVVGGSGDESAIADAVAATLAALRPTEVPTRAADYLATLQAGLGKARSEYPNVALNPLDPSGGREFGLNETEMRVFQNVGSHFWEMLQAWVVVRSILESRDVYEWEHRWLAEELDLVGWMMPETGRLSPDLWEGDEVGEVVKAYLVEVREAEYAFRDAVSALNSAMGVFEKAGAERFVELDGEEQDEVWQFFFDAQSRAVELGSVMSAYGCSICGELYRRSGVAARRE